MYAEQTKTGYNLINLSEEEMGAIEIGLSSIRMNTPEYLVAQNLWQKIDNELSEPQN